MCAATKGVWAVAIWHSGRPTIQSVVGVRNLSRETKTRHSLRV